MIRFKLCLTWWQLQQELAGPMDQRLVDCWQRVAAMALPWRELCYRKVPAGLLGAQKQAQGWHLLRQLRLCWWGQACCLPVQPQGLASCPEAGCRPVSALLGTAEALWGASGLPAAW